MLIGGPSADREYLGLLLSNHLDLPRPMGHERRLRVQQHYFSSPALHALLEQSAEGKSAERIMALGLLLEEGLDTGQLWGLALPWAEYLLLRKAGWQADHSTCFFLLEAASWSALREEDQNLIQRDLQQVQTPAFNALFFQSIPHRVLQTCADFLKVGTREPEKISAQPLRPLPVLTDRQKEGWKEISQFDTILPQWMGDERIEIITISEPDWDQAEKAEGTGWRLAFEAFFPGRWQETASIPEEGKQTADSNPIALFNRVIRESSCRYIWLTRPGGDIAADLFEPVFSQQTLFSCTAAHPAPGPVQADALQLLTLYTPERNAVLKRDDFLALGGFDESMTISAAIWDLLVRLLQENTDQRATVLPAEQTPETDSKPLQEVVQKHRAFLQHSADELISLLQTGQHQTLEDLHAAQEKLHTLNRLLQHTREEIRSMQHLNAQLHSRIRHLESSRYIRFKMRLQRLKRIFFKKKSPGSGTLKRLLQFLRFSLSKAGFGILRRFMAGALKHLYLWVEKRPVEIRFLDKPTVGGIHSYHDWIMHKLQPSRLQTYYRSICEEWENGPLISILMPTYNTPVRYLREAIESVTAQLYGNWELCIADDCSTEPVVRRVLHGYAVKDARIRVSYRETNGHISEASNTALSMARGEYVLLMDHDDLLSANCLAEVSRAIRRHPEADLIYSDEDKVHDNGHHEAAHFKPDWAPDHLLSRNYLGHVVVLRRELTERVGGFRTGFEGSQDYDLLLRITEASRNIVHIPKVLYHWRIHSLSAAQGEEVKPYAYIAAKRALAEALQRRGLQGEVKYLSGLRGYRIDYAIRKPGKVSIIIPTKDQAVLLQNTIDSILQKTDYKDYEIIILNNNSKTPELERLLERYTREYPERIRATAAHFPFNFSKLMNLGRKLSTGEYLLLLNNDVEVIHADWLGTMVSYAQQERIGAVGVRLLYPDDTIQHAGVIIGLGGIAGHSFVGSYREDPGYFNYIQSVNNYSAVTAACLMVRADAWDRVGGMNEQFEVEYNDVDFCLRLQEAGYNNVYLPQVELYHYESATRGHPHQSRASYERHLSEMEKFSKRWQALIDHDPCYNPNLNRGVHDFGMNFSA